MLIALNRNVIKTNTNQLIIHKFILHNVNQTKINYIKTIK